MSLEANKQLVRQHYEDLVNQNNPAAADRQVSEDFVDHSALPGVVSRGPESARQAMAVLHAAIPDVHITLDEAIAEGDIVAVRATWIGTHQGTLAGIPPSGKPVTAKGLIFWRVANGKLVERWATVDLSSLRAQPPK